MSEEQKREITQLEVDKILIPEDRVTSVFDSETYEELKRSIKQHGILQPLQVALVDGKYVLVDGLHRLMIARELGYKTVPCIVKRMTEDQLLITNLIMNRQRGRSNPAEEAKILVKLVDEYKYDFDKACEVLGFSRSTGDKYYRIGKYLAPEVLEMLHDGLISAGCAYWLTFIDDRGKQVELAKQFSEWGYTVEQCKARVQYELNPAKEVPYTFEPSGEVKPKPVPVYPCGREVDPSRVVVVQVDAEVWPLIQSAFEQLCNEGFFYGEKTETEATTSVEEEAQTTAETTQPQAQQETKPTEKKDWFIEKL
jgi:ParB family chromosome partitioning protein